VAIMLVIDGERCLLGQPAGRLARSGFYSALAGFVDQGESIEEAVRREVREEAGIAVGAVRYHSSQPWPFPSSLMLGFVATAASTGIELGDDELEDARWFTRAEIASGSVALPTPYSVSFRLIADWYDSGADRPLTEEPGVKLWKSSR
jgi:NAD+ diphosphatase